MASTNWSVPGNVALKWREWDGDFVVFNPASGDTHFLNALAGSVLRILESRPASLDDIVSELERTSGKALTSARVDELRDLVDELDAVGLVEPVSQ